MNAAGLTFVAIEGTEAQRLGGFGRNDHPLAIAATNNLPRLGRCERIQEPGHREFKPVFELRLTQKLISFDTFFKN